MGTGGGSSRGGGSHLGPRSTRTTMKSGFHSVELNKTVWEVPERYVNLTAIGSGAYGQVCSAEDTSLRSADGKFIKVAIKKIARPFQSAVHAKRTYRELRMLKHMVHENIIGLLDCFTPQSTLDQHHQDPEAFRRPRPVPHLPDHPWHEVRPFRGDYSPGPEAVKHRCE